MKNEIRYRMKIKRRYLGEIVRLEADRAILETFSQAFSGYDSFFVYNSFSTEARTDLIVEWLLAADKRVYLPRVEGDNIVPVPYTGSENFTKGAYGIDEPVGSASCETAEITVIPLLAVNSRGYRIGYGKGYYDRFLADKKTLKVGIGYNFQIEEFKEDKHDVPLDIFISERGIYRFEKETI